MARMQHLLILDYKNDAERKRIDYTIEKWSAKANVTVTKPKGVVVLFEGDTLSRFVEDVCSRRDAASELPKIYALNECVPFVVEKTQQLEFSTAKSADIVENFVNYLLAKQSAAFEFSDGSKKVYAARTRKGLARIVVDIEPGKNTRCRITVEGYGEVVDFVAGKIDDEMKVFLEGA